MLDGFYFNNIIIKRYAKFLLLFVLNQFVMLPVALLIDTKDMSTRILWTIAYFVIYSFVLSLAWRFYCQEVPQPKLRFPFHHKVRAIMVGFSILIGYLLYSSSLSSLSNRVYHQLQSSNNSSIHQALKQATTNPIGLVVMLLAIVVLSPVLEEVIFRGVLGNIHASLFLGLILNGVMFALNHGQTNFFLFMSYAGLGMVLYLISRYTRSLLPGIMLHVANNLIAVGVFLLSIYLH